MLGEWVLSCIIRVLFFKQKRVNPKSYWLMFKKKYVLAQVTRKPRHKWLQAWLDPGAG